MRLRKFNCTENELYAACAYGWESFSHHLDRFYALKPKYNAAFLKEKKAELGRVMKMHDHNQRSAASEQSRKTLKHHAELCLQAWKKLRLYIEGAWPADEHDMMLKGAGLPDYKEAVKFRWETFSSLLSSAQAFIQDNKDRLLTGNNMPKSFPEEFNKLAMAFSAENLRHQDTVKQSAILATEKTAANNGLYADLMSMFKDARMIFRKEPDTLRFFTFDYVLLLLSGPGTAGIKGVVSNAQLPLRPIPGLELVIIETGDTLTPGEDGSYRFNQLAAGLYTLRVTAPGYKPYTQEGIQVSTGVHKIVNVVMEKEE
mgnify:CR=1 FL=1